MEEIPDAYLAGLVGFVVSAIITLAIHKSRHDSPTISLKNPGTKWFMSASVCFSFAVLSLNTALYHGGYPSDPYSGCLANFYSLTKYWYISTRDYYQAYYFGRLFGRSSGNANSNRVNPLFCYNSQTVISKTKYSLGSQLNS